MNEKQLTEVQTVGPLRYPSAGKTIPYRYRVLVFLFFLTFITMLDRISISLVGVSIKTDFNLNNTQWGWVTGAFALAYAIFELPSGMLGDRQGQRAALIRIVFFWSVLTALTGLTTGLVSLIIVRFLFGMGEAGAFPNSSAVISRWFPAGESSLGVSSLMAGVCVGSSIAPLIVVPVAVALGWRASFWVNGAIGLLWVAVCYSWFRNNPSEMKGMPAKEIEFIETNRRVTSHVEKISWKIIANSRTLLALAISAFCSMWNLYFLVAWMAIFLRQGRHFTVSEMMWATSFVFIPAAIVSIFGGLLSDWVIKKKGLKFGRRLFGALSTGMTGVLIFIAAITSGKTVLVICLATNMMFQQFVGIATFGVCIDIGGKHTGRIAGIVNGFGQIGACFMATVFGVIVDFTSQNYNAPLFVITGVLLVGALLFLLVDPTKKLVTEVAE